MHKYNCYNIAVGLKKNPKKYRFLTDNDWDEIGCLIGQYNYGLAAKKELYYKLVSLGIIEDENN